MAQNLNDYGITSGWTYVGNINDFRLRVVGLVTIVVHADRNERY